MFALVISILAAALTAAVTVTGLFYANGMHKAVEGRVVVAILTQQAAQISQAAHDYARDKDVEPGTGALSSLDGLVSSGYLLSLPSPPGQAGTAWAVDLASMRAWVDLRADAGAVCAEAQRAATGDASVPALVADINGVFASSQAAYGCARTGAAETAGTFFVRL